MPNIAITNYCNLKCPYCFADDMIQEEKEFITMDNFLTFLSFVSRSGPQRIGIIGGEPTLHPQFGNILYMLNQYCYDAQSTGVVFTNGIELEKWLNYIGDDVTVLVNCNNPKNQTEKQYSKMIHTLEVAASKGMIESDKVRCGCNIYLDGDYSYFWNIVDKFHNPVVRCSIVSPGGCYKKQWSNQESKENYYRKLKPMLIDFVKEADKRNVKIGFDCNQIPICMLTDEEKILIERVAEALYQPICAPVIDVDTSLKAFSCFGTYDSNGAEIKDFNNFEEVQRYLFLEYTSNKIKQNGKGMCEGCKQHELYQCQGGCLSFVENGGTK